MWLNCLPWQVRRMAFSKINLSDEYFLCTKVLTAAVLPLDVVVFCAGMECSLFVWVELCCIFMSYCCPPQKKKKTFWQHRFTPALSKNTFSQKDLLGHIKLTLQKHFQGVSYVEAYEKCIHSHYSKVIIFRYPHD